MEVGDNNTDRTKLRRAKKRLYELKGFYWHFGVYLVVNLALTIPKLVRILGSSESFTDFDSRFFDFEMFSLWFFWGIGLAFHAIKVFSLNPIFGKEWEKRQIQKFIEKEKKEIEKYR